VAGLLIVIAAMQVFGVDVMGLWSVPLIAVALWWYGWIRQMDDGGLSPRNDELPPDSELVTPGRFVAPRSLVVVSMQVPESDPIDVVVWLPSLRTFTGILSPEQVIGRLTRSRKDGGSLDPANFMEHEFFVQFLHEFLERELPGRPDLQKESRRTQDGWVSCVDARVLDAPRAEADRGPDDEDVIGRFHVQGGVIEPGSYQRNRAHRLLTEKGLFRLEFALSERLRQEIIARHAFAQAGDASSDRVM
jgi:hypothetical protein